MSGVVAEMGELLSKGCLSMGGGLLSRGKCPAFCWNSLHTVKICSIPVKGNWLTM